MTESKGLPDCCANDLAAHCSQISRGNNVSATPPTLAADTMTDRGEQPPVVRDQTRHWWAVVRRVIRSHASLVSEC